jgi:TnpA family transposase
VGGRLVAAGSDVTVDRDGRLHVASLKAVPEPPSLTELRESVAAMLPRIDLPEVVLEVMRWEPGFIRAFTARSGGRPRMADLDISVAACLSAQAMNIGYRPVARKGVPALAPDRLSHVAQTYFDAENVGAANSPLFSRQARIAFAQALGGGLVAAVDGMRFVVPVPSVYARPNRNYFGSNKGVTWLNMMSDQAAGLAAKVVSGTVRDSLHVIDVLYSQDGGQRPDIVVTDTGSYSDVVFGLLQLLGFEYRPALADIPDQRLWRGGPRASYGPLDVAARGKLDLDKIVRHWPDIVRVVGSIHTGAVRAYDVVRMLQRDGHPTPLGEAIAHYGRIFKSLHILAFIDDETYRRDIKGIRNLQEGRHDLAQKIFHGRKGELYQRYHAGMEDQLGASAWSSTASYCGTPSTSTPLSNSSEPPGIRWPTKTSLGCLPSCANT